MVTSIAVGGNQVELKENITIHRLLPDHLCMAREEGLCTDRVGERV